MRRSRTSKHQHRGVGVLQHLAATIVVVIRSPEAPGGSSSAVTISGPTRPVPSKFLPGVYCEVLRWKSRTLDVVEDRVAGDVIQRLPQGDVAAAFADEWRARPRSRAAPRRFGRITGAPAATSEVGTRRKKDG